MFPTLRPRAPAERAHGRWVWANAGRLGCGLSASAAFAVALLGGWLGCGLGVRLLDAVAGLVDGVIGCGVDDLVPERVACLGEGRRDLLCRAFDDPFDAGAAGGRCCLDGCARHIVSLF